MKSKYLLILTLIIISCLSIGVVSATDDGVNETIITADNDFEDDILESEIDNDIIGEDESDEILEGIVINPPSPSGPGSLRDFKILFLRNIFFG